VALPGQRICCHAFKSSASDHDSTCSSPLQGRVARRIFQRACTGGCQRFLLAAHVRSKSQRFEIEDIVGKLEPLAQQVP